MMRQPSLLFILLVATATHGFTVQPMTSSFSVASKSLVMNSVPTQLNLAADDESTATTTTTTTSSSSNSVTDGVVELGDDNDERKPSESTMVAPFLSQGEIADDVLNPDLSDPKQTRVIIYIILSLVPVLFLVPLMLGSRDLIPMDILPPVDL